MIYQKKCETCGKVFERKSGTLSDKQWNNRRFCSMKCNAPHHSKIMKGQPSKLKGKWRVSDVCYSGLHYRIKQMLKKPLACQNCGANKPLDLCNISGNYLLNISDWIYMCRKCHMNSDGRMDGLKEMAFKKK
jgi:hypothetical protein